MRESGLNANPGNSKGQQCRKSYTGKFLKAKRDGETYFILKSQALKKNKHSKDFEIEDSPNSIREQVQMFQQKLKSHIEDPENSKIYGTYGLRRDEKEKMGSNNAFDAIHIYNRKTNVNVVINQKTKRFVTNESQRNDLQKNQNIT